MTLLSKYLLLLLFLFSIKPLFSQDVIQVDFQKVFFQEMVDSLEKKYSLRFFYQQEWIDSVKVSVKGNFSKTSALLDEMIKGTELQYFLARNGDIILSKIHSVKAELSQGFWDGTEVEEEATASQEIFVNLEPEVDDSPLDNALNKVYEIGKDMSGQTTAALAGYVHVARTGEPMVGVSVFVTSLQTGTLTDGFGYFIVNLPAGEHKVEFQYIGKENTYRWVNIKGDGQLDVEMDEEVLALDEIVISGEKSQVESVQTGAAKLNIAEIKTIPTLLGEADVMKISLTLPGVQSVGEGASGFNVRGGSTDQNLIMLNGATLYNPNHLFGFFSAFNPAVIKHADLYKSGIQAKYGGRVSSVLDVVIRDGNKKKFIAAAGIGPVTSKVSVEGPMLNKKGTYIVGLRSTYANWLLKALNNPSLNRSSAFFADGVGKVNYQLDDNNFLTFSAYHSQDRFRLDGDSLYSYKNTNASLTWRHAFNNQFSVRTSTGITNYQFGLESDDSPGNAFELDYQVNQGHLNVDFDLFPNAKHHFQFGWQNTYYQLNPGEVQPVGDSSFVRPIVLDQEQGFETALYLGDEWTISPQFSVSLGLRFSGYTMLGQGNVFIYQDGLPKEPDFITDTVSYESGARIVSYGGPEYRIAGRYKLNESFSLKFSYDKTRQYIHMLTNTIAVSPTDTWRLSNPYLKPQMGDQWALGLYKEFPSGGYELSLEGYYKNIHNLLEYKDGASLLLNETLESDVISAFGKSYGVEFLFKKKTGQFNGWISYTYSRTLVQADSPFKSERINDGEFYPANYDIPHNLSIITNYKFNRRINFSLNLAYRTGRPTTLPIIQYQLRDNVLAFFSDRNQFRVPDYFRMDLAFNFEGNHKVEKNGHSSWSVSLYNLTGRKNAYSVFTRAENDNIGTYKLSIFGTVIPTLIYNFELR